MTTIQRDVRRDVRYPILCGEGTTVEVVDPARPGKTRRFGVIELSVAGLSFWSEDRLEEMEAGTKLVDVKLRVENCVMEGDLLIRHVRRSSRDGTAIGALFYPACENDQTKLMGVLAGMKAIYRGSVDEKG